MADSDRNLEDFESTIPLDIGKLNPYAQKDEQHTISETDFVDLDTELNALSSRMAAIDTNPETSTQEQKVAIEPFNATHDPRKDIETQKMVVKTKKLSQANDTPMKQSAPTTGQPNRKAKPVNPSAAPRKSQVNKQVQRKELPKQPSAQNVLEKQKVNVKKEVAHGQSNEKADASVIAVQESNHEKAKTITKSKEPVVKIEGGKNGSGQVWSMLLACLGLVVGGVGIWLAIDAQTQVSMLQQKVYNLELKTNFKAVETEPNTARKSTLQGGDTAATMKNQMKKVAPAKAVQPKKTDAKAIIVREVITPETPSIQVYKPQQKGTWVVNVSSDTLLARAEKMKARLEKSGIQSVITPAKVKGTTWYRVQVLGFLSKKDAKSYVAKLQREQGIQDVWVGKSN